jgi:XTP/dITP diphosphohydrolase
MLIVFATSNRHKLDEVRPVMAACGLEVIALDELGDAIAEPVEDGDTFEANARIKAIAYARASGRRCLAEDSGLEVDALGGAPGVHSARYAAEGGDRAARDQANNALLLERIAAIPEAQRSARFVCAMCLAEPDGRVLYETRGSYEGIITSTPRGDNGFGYDPLLFLPDLGVTSAELSPEAKNARSHRGQAVRAMAEALKAIG